MEPNTKIIPSTTGPRATAVSPTPKPRGLIIHKGDIWRPVEHPLYRSYEKDTTVAAVTDDPKLTWIGPKIPMELYARIISFLKWANDTHKSEAMVRLFLNQRERRWEAWAFPQEAMGLSVNETSTAADLACVANFGGVEVDRAGGPGWDLAGSFHSHCDVNAFQSGTDHADELGVEGLHVTIGHLASARMSLHGRFTQNRGGNKVFFPIDWSQWFEPDGMPVLVDNLPFDLKSKILEWNLTDIDALALPEPPREWVANYKRRTYAPVTHTVYGGGGIGNYRSFEENNKAFARALLSVAASWNVDTSTLLSLVEIYEEIKDAGKEHNVFDSDRIACILEALVNNNDDPNCKEVADVVFASIPEYRRARNQQRLIDTANTVNAANGATTGSGAAAKLGPSDIDYQDEIGRGWVGYE